jgi:hypothetical protein
LYDRLIVDADIGLQAIKWFIRVVSYFIHWRRGRPHHGCSGLGLDASEDRSDICPVLRERDG